MPSAPTSRPFTPSAAAAPAMSIFGRTTAQLAFEFGRRAARVDGHGDRAHAEHGEVRRYEEPVVGQCNRDAISGLEPKTNERSAQFGHLTT